MMNFYRVTKYNPLYRDEDGNYKKSEWTSYHDIGKNFDGKPLTLDDYVLVEQAYIDFVLFLCKMSNVSNFTLSSLENYDNTKWTNGLISIDEVQDFIKDCLREKCWGKLSCKNLVIHFGYDYYMYIGLDSTSINIFAVSKNYNLFCEKGKSPYI